MLQRCWRRNNLWSCSSLPRKSTSVVDVPRATFVPLASSAATTCQAHAAKAKLNTIDNIHAAHRCLSRVVENNWQSRPTNCHGWVGDGCAVGGGLLLEDGWRLLRRWKDTKANRARLSLKNHKTSLNEMKSGTKIPHACRWPWHSSVRWRRPLCVSPWRQRRRERFRNRAETETWRLLVRKAP